MFKHINQPFLQNKSNDLLLLLLIPPIIAFLVYNYAFGNSKPLSLEAITSTLIAITFISIVIARKGKDIVLRKNPVILLFIALLLERIVAGVIVSGQPKLPSMFFVDLSFETLCILIAAYTTISPRMDPNETRKYSARLSIIAVVFSVYAYAFYPSVGALLGNKNYDANIIAVLSIFLLSFANYRHISPSGNYRGYKNTALLLFAICFLALVNLQARGALISVIIGSIYFFATLIAKKEAEQSRSSAIILLLMLLGVGAYVAFEIESIRTFLSSDSIESRIRVIQSSFELFKHSPILGFGLSSYSDLALSHPDITSAYSGYNNISYADNPHNLFVNLIIEGGLIGVTLMAAILFFSYRSTSGTCLFSLSVRTAIIVYVFNSLTTAAIFYPINMLIMFTLLSLLPPKANANEE